MLAAGFKNEPSGTHTSKTMMLPELRSLLAAVPGAATFDEYRRASIDDNALGKASAANRKRTFHFLRELYALRGDVPVFGALRELWPTDPSAQPMIAFLCASARDPLLRATADLVLNLDEGATVDARTLAREVEGSFPERYSPGVLHHIGQNAAASWTQAGLLAGSRTKRRTQATATPPAIAYALFLGHLEGRGGTALFETLWARILDAQAGGLHVLAQTAARAGWIDFKSAGGMIEITFSHLDALTRPMPAAKVMTA
jgi:hypothetical protein